jgi:exosortase
MIILLCGLPVLRYAWLPYLYLFFAIPLPKRIYFQLTDPLRRIAAVISASALGTIPSLSIERKGSVLEYLYQGGFGTIGVEDACSGMRATIVLCALGVAMAFISKRPLSHRIVMLAACIPIATLCNAFRVLVTCYLTIFVDAKYATGTYHTAFGLVVLLIAFGMYGGIGWILNNLFVEVPDADDASGSVEAAAH